MDRMEICRRLAVAAKQKPRKRKPHQHYVDCSSLQMSGGWMRKRKFIKPVGADTLTAIRRWFKRQQKKFGVPFTVPVVVVQQPKR